MYITLTDSGFSDEKTVRTHNLDTWNGGVQKPALFLQHTTKASDQRSYKSSKPQAYDDI